MEISYDTNKNAVAQWTDYYGTMDVGRIEIMLRELFKDDLLVIGEKQTRPDQIREGDPTPRNNTVDFSDWAKRIFNTTDVGDGNASNGYELCYRDGKATPAEFKRLVSVFLADKNTNGVVDARELKNLFRQFMYSYPTAPTPPKPAALTLQGVDMQAWVDPKTKLLTAPNIANMLKNLYPILEAQAQPKFFDNWAAKIIEKVSGNKGAPGISTAALMANLAAGKADASRDNVVSREELKNYLKTLRG